MVSIAACSCTAAYQVIVSTVDRHVILREPLAPIPFGEPMEASAIVTGSAAVLRKGHAEE